MSQPINQRPALTGPRFGQCLVFTGNHRVTYVFRADNALKAAWILNASGICLFAVGNIAKDRRTNSRCINLQRCTVKWKHELIAVQVLCLTLINALNDVPCFLSCFSTLINLFSVIGSGISKQGTINCINYWFGTFRFAFWWEFRVLFGIQLMLRTLMITGQKYLHCEDIMAPLSIAML